MSNPAHTIGVVGSIVLVTALAVAVFFYMRNSREKVVQQPQPQPQNFSPDGMDPYKQQTPSMYGPPPPIINTVPFTPYVSLSRGTDLRRYLDSHPPESLRSIDVPSSKSAKFGNIHHYPNSPHRWWIFWYSRAVAARWLSKSLPYIFAPFFIC